MACSFLFYKSRSSFIFFFLILSDWECHSSDFLVVFLTNIHVEVIIRDLRCMPSFATECVSRVYDLFKKLTALLAQCFLFLERLALGYYLVN